MKTLSKLVIWIFFLAHEEDNQMFASGCMFLEGFLLWFWFVLCFVFSPSDGATAGGSMTLWFS